MAQSTVAAVAAYFTHNARFNVKDYGAVGDGSTNDRTAIADADAGAVAEAQGGALFFPQGVYIINSSLTISSACYFAAGAKIKPAGGATITFAGLVDTEGTQHFDLSNAGALLEPDSGYRKFASRWGAVFPLLHMGETGGALPIPGAFEHTLGHIAKYVEKLQFQINGPNAMSGALVSGSITSIQNVANEFTDNTKSWTVNQRAPVHETLHVMKFTSGNQNGKYRYLRSNTATKVTCGVDFFTGTYGNPVVGDTYEIRSVSLTAALQSVMQLYNVTDEDGTPIKAGARFNETAEDKGFEFLFGRWDPIGARVFVELIAAGGGVYDIAFGEASSMWRHMLFRLNDVDPWLAGYKDASSGLVDTVVGKQAALATNATRGFLWIPSGAGAPTGTPASYTGKVPLYADTTNNKLYIYSGGSWVALN